MNDKANSLREVARQTAKLWRKHHLTYDQTKHVVEQTRRELGVEAPGERRRTVERLDRVEVERLIESAYVHSSQYGFMVKMLFYTGARVSEFVQLRVEDLHDACWDTFGGLIRRVGIRKNTGSGRPGILF